MAIHHSTMPGEEERDVVKRDDPRQACDQICLELERPASISRCAER